MGSSQQMKRFIVCLRSVHCFLINSMLLIEDKKKPPFSRTDGGFYRSEKMLQTIELYCGHKSFSNEAEKKGMATFTLDINKRFKADLVTNILNTTAADYPQRPFIIWASPDCTFYSCASAWKHWNRQNEPQTIFSEAAIRIMKHTINIIMDLQPTYWFIENPTGKLRKMDFMQDFPRHQVTYCQYGEKRRKPTDIWTNNTHWKPRPICEMTDDCHPGSTKKMNTPAQRSVIPIQLIQEILSSCK